MKFWYFLIACVIIVLVLAIIDRILKINHEKEIVNKVTSICNKNHYGLKVFGKGQYDFLITTFEVDLYIKVAFIPSNSSLTVNNKSTWCLRWGGSGRIGRSYPNKRYLDELKGFLETKYESTKKVQKVCILYPSTEEILKYLNESEICVLKTKDLAYDTKIIRFNRLEEEFNDLL